MFFEWDDTKNRANIRKHGIDFNDVPDMFQHPMLVLRDDRIDYGEDRWIGLGRLMALFAVVVYCERSGEIVRIISACKATKDEARRYAKRIEN